MSSLIKSRTVMTGLAMFSMFFGAGNVVFPLMLGNHAGDKSIVAVLGLVITGIIVPFSGLLAMILFQGDYKQFFGRLGKIPGAILILLIMALIGPFAGIPRCITLSHSTLAFSGLTTPLWLFSLIACGIVFLMSFRKSCIVSILGNILTPLLLVSLVIIIVQGLFAASDPISVEHTNLDVFLTGLKEGYNTLDLPAAFFFSMVILAKIREQRENFDDSSSRHQALTTLKSSVIGASLLILIYVGMCRVASLHSSVFSEVQADQLLAAIAMEILGTKAGLIANLAVALACLTTSIVLACVFAEFLRDSVFMKKVAYIPCLLLTLAITWLMSELGFMKILQLVAPIVALCYPIFIALTYLNIAYKLWHFKPIKAIALAVFAISLLFTLW